MSLIVRAILLPLAGVLWLAVACAHAQEPAEYKEAIAQAVEEYERGNWDEAYALFKRSHELAPSARTRRGIGVVAFELKLYVECVLALDAALNDVRKPLTQEQRAAAVELMARARMFVATYKVTVRPEGARVLVDDSPAQFFDGMLLLDPGEHTLEVEAVHQVSERRAVRAVAGGRAELSFELGHGLSASPPGQPTTEAQAASKSEPAWHWTWSLSAAALAAGAAGGGLALATQHEHEQFAACDLTVSDSNCSSSARGQRLQLATNVTLASAGMLAIGAITAFFIERPSRRDRSVRTTLVPTRAGLAVHGVF